MVVMPTSKASSVWSYASGVDHAEYWKNENICFTCTLRWFQCYRYLFYSCSYRVLNWLTYPKGCNNQCSYMQLLLFAITVNKLRQNYESIMLFNFPWINIEFLHHPIPVYDKMTLFYSQWKYLCFLFGLW